MKYFISCVSVVLLLTACKKDDPGEKPEPGTGTFSYVSATLNGKAIQPFMDISISPEIKIRFSMPVKRSSVSEKILISDFLGGTIDANYSFERNDSVVSIKPRSPLQYLSQYKVQLLPGLLANSNSTLPTGQEISFATSLDSSRKFPALSDSALLDTIQKRTFKYFWDYGHPVSGLARERSNATPETVTTGGSGFGVMALLAGIQRGFISRADGLNRVQTIVSFLKNKAQKFHGAFPHWLNGSTGAVIPFSANDNGADLVETSFLMMGLLTARQYFSGSDAATVSLRNDINSLWNAVEWNWFRQNNQDVLYWHWSPSSNWAINLKVQGWNECLITYVLAAASPTSAISKQVYDIGWARSGSIKNGAQFYNYALPLGENLGGPLFLEHYSFLGINPNGLIDAYANYQTQTKNHTLINYEYCKDNPKNYFGYSDSVWGLTASDIRGGYTASSPTNDQGFIAPTAALSSIPYTPDQSMAALKFYYYVLGDKLFKEYGFVDAFSLDVMKNNGAWFADSHLAIDQGPIIVMIENYRTRLFWNLFMSAPEVKSGLKKLGFTGPGL